MTVHNIGIADTILGSRPLEDRVDVAARQMYEAEVALHIARQAGVGAWAAAAYNRLHEAVAEHSDALAQLRSSPIFTAPGPEEAVPSPLRSEAPACG